MQPKPQMIKYHEAFLKGYLELLLFRQQYGTIKVPKAINESLNNMIQHQGTNIGEYKKKKDNDLGLYERKSLTIWGWVFFPAV